MRTSALCLAVRAASACTQRSVSMHGLQCAPRSIGESLQHSVVASIHVRHMGMFDWAKEKLTGKPKTTTAPVSGSPSASPAFSEKIRNVLKGERSGDEDIIKSMETVMFSADIGGTATERLVSRARKALAELRSNGVSGADAAMLSHLSTQLASEAAEILQSPTRSMPFDENVSPHKAPRDSEPVVLFLVGPNGVGKTTTSVKLAHWFRHHQQKSVLLVAGDTFRAAAVAQVHEWGQRLDIPVFSIQQKAKSTVNPSTVIRQGIERGIKTGVDLIIVDTAGRQHNKAGLMKELKKMCKEAKIKVTNAPHHTWLVCDAMVGSNTLTQAAAFKQTAGVDGYIMAKVDSTAKGGVVMAMAQELKLPLMFVGVGEGYGDLVEFDSEATQTFCKNLFDVGDDTSVQL